MDVWNELHDGVERVLPDATEDILQTVINKPMAPPHVKTVLGALIFYGWHEAYHMGNHGDDPCHIELPGDFKTHYGKFSKMKRYGSLTNDYEP